MYVSIEIGKNNTNIQTSKQLTNHIHFNVKMHKVPKMQTALNAIRTHEMKFIELYALSVNVLYLFRLHRVAVTN